MAEFFISYTPADLEWAEWIAWVLEEAGHQTRIQAWDFPPGCNFVVGINKAAIECDWTVAVLSPDYLKSLYATHEWSAAFADGKLLTVRVRDMKVEGLLSPISYIDLVNLSEAAARERLVNGIAPGGRRKPLQRPGFPFPGEVAADPILKHSLSRLEDLPLDKIPDPAPLPAGSRMPYAVNPMFVGRDEDLRLLARALKAGESAAIGQLAAATGLGGIGKTQLASEFVHRYGRFFEGGVFWMSFADRAGVPAEVAACGRNLGLDPQFEDLPLERQVQLVRDSWLSPLPRLLVFDNCEEPDLLQKWRPTTGRARVLLTSRRAGWDPTFGIHSHALETLSRPASIELLRRFRPDLPEGDTALGEIAQELGDLPLALHLAGSFLQRYKHAPFGQPKIYLEDLGRGDLLDHPSLQGVRAGPIPTGHDAHVARTFALSYERLDSEDRVDALAQRLLARASYFAPGEPIPRDLLTATFMSDESSVSVELEEALGRLSDLGLIEQGEDGRVWMHRLVATFVRLSCRGPEDQISVETALCIEASRINKAGYPEALLAWQSHLRLVTETALGRQDLVATGLCNELGVHLWRLGEYSNARRYLEQALANCKDELGPEHRDTATCMNNFALLLKEMGDFLGARPYFEQALAIRENVLGPEHPETARVLNNLGALHRDLGDLATAQCYFEQALSIWEKLPEQRYSQIVACLNNFALLLQDLGDMPGARSYLERALAACENFLGPEHPDTASSLYNLGLLEKKLGNISEAHFLYKRALEIFIHGLGPDHPRTKVTRQSLEILLKELPKPAVTQE